MVTTPAVRLSSASGPKRGEMGLLGAALPLPTTPPFPLADREGNCIAEQLSSMNEWGLSSGSLHGGIA